MVRSKFFGDDGVAVALAAFRLSVDGSSHLSRPSSRTGPVTAFPIGPEDKNFLYHSRKYSK